MKSIISNEDLFFNEEPIEENSFENELTELDSILAEEVTADSFGIEAPTNIVNMHKPTPRKFPKVKPLNYCFGNAANQVRWMTRKAMKGDSKLKRFH